MKVPESTTASRPSAPPGVAQEGTRTGLPGPVRRILSDQLGASGAEALRLVEHIVGTGSWPADARWAADR
jgi:hypothetical protein